MAAGYPWAKTLEAISELVGRGALMPYDAEYASRGSLAWHEMAARGGSPRLEHLARHWPDF
jgi:hypothetical protein